ncbi:MAG: RNA polymerase sigma factor, partial [Planctomycetia bacterium]
MEPTSEHDTTPSLFDRLQDPASAAGAWDEFVDRYGRLLYRWCRRWGVQESDAEDVTQNVLLA